MFKAINSFDMKSVVVNRCLVIVSSADRQSLLIISRDLIGNFLVPIDAT